MYRFPLKFSFHPNNLSQVGKKIFAFPVNKRIRNTLYYNICLPLKKNLNLDEKGKKTNTYPIISKKSKNQKKKPLSTFLFVCILILCIYVIPSFCKNSFTWKPSFTSYAPSFHKPQIFFQTSNPIFRFLGVFIS